MQLVQVNNPRRPLPIHCVHFCDGCGTSISPWPLQAIQLNIARLPDPLQFAHFSFSYEVLAGSACIIPPCAFAPFCMLADITIIAPQRTNGKEFRKKRKSMSFFLMSHLKSNLI